MTSDREAEAIAVRFMGMGYHAVVLRYSVAPARYPWLSVSWQNSSSSQREQRSSGILKRIRSLYPAFRQEATGTSLGVFWNTEELRGITGMENERIRPNGMILNYP